MNCVLCVGNYKKFSVLLPSRQKWMTDSQKPFQGHSHRTVYTAHQTSLSDWNNDWQGFDSEELVITWPEFCDAK